MLYYGSEWICWCFQNRWLNLSMAGLIGRYCAPSFELYMLFCFEASWCIWEVLRKKKRKSSTKRKETQNRLIRPSSASIWWKLPRHGVVACRNCQGNIPIMVRSQKCNLYSASTKSAGGKVTTRNTADQKYAFMKDWWPFFCRLIKPSFFLEALMIGFLWGFQDSKWRFRFDPMLLLFQCLQ